MTIAGMSAKESCTLEFGSLWMFSAMAGREQGFDWLELESFRDTVDRLSCRGGLSGKILTSVAARHSEVLAEFTADRRSVSSGIRDVLTVLSTVEGDDAHEFKRTLLEIGRAIGTARGPFGRSMSFEGGQMLTLLAQLLDFWPRRDASAA